MKSIKIISLTEKGELSIKQHYEEYIKKSAIKRMAVRLLLKKIGINQEVSCEKPYTLRVWATPNSSFSMVKNAHIEQEIDLALKANSAERNIDYFYEEE